MIGSLPSEFMIHLERNIGTREGMSVPPTILLGVGLTGPGSPPLRKAPCRIVPQIE